LLTWHSSRIAPRGRRSRMMVLEVVVLYAFDLPQSQDTGK
jgi:hypothetical protein